MEKPKNIKCTIQTFSSLQLMKAGIYDNKHDLYLSLAFIDSTNFDKRVLGNMVKLLLIIIRGGIL